VIEGLTREEDDALAAAVDMIGSDGVPVADADWYAHAKYRGTRVTVEHKNSPVEAAEALCRLLLDGSRCTWCGGIVMLGPLLWVPDVVTFLDGRTMTKDEIAAAEKCSYRREGRKWVRWCADRFPDPPTSRRERRRK
jgi:hypothetical protein